MISAACSDAPRLSDISIDGEEFDSLLKSFVCDSVPVATKARRDHASELRLLQQPWWRKLGDEYQDNKFSLEDDEDTDSWKVF